MKSAGLPGWTLWTKGLRNTTPWVTFLHRRLQIREVEVRFQNRRILPVATRLVRKHLDFGPLCSRLLVQRTRADRGGRSALGRLPQHRSDSNDYRKSVCKSVQIPE
jgi:hypothetical protein